MKEKKMRKMIVSWKMQQEMIQYIYRKIREDGFDPDFVAAIARGGLTIGQCFSHWFDAPIVLIGAESWSGGEHSEEVHFARHSLYMTDDVSGTILLVDDLTDSGRTLVKAEEYLGGKFPGITAVKTACLLHKETSAVEPDYYAKLVKVDQDGNTPWVEFPQERPPL